MSTTLLNFHHKQMDILAQKYIQIIDLRVEEITFTSTLKIHLEFCLLSYCHFPTIHSVSMRTTGYVFKSKYLMLETLQ